MKTDKVRSILMAAERSLADVANEAVVAGEYDRATLILGIASQLSSIVRGLPSNTQSAPVAAAQSEPRPSGLREIRKKGKRSTYPRFYREGNALLKVGYSKRGGEYEHKAPSQVLFALSEAVAKIGDKNRRFTMEDVLPLIAASQESAVPVYQPYVCLSWLRDLGLIAQHGRKGYSAKVASQIPQHVRAQWDELSQRLDDHD